MNFLYEIPTKFIDPVAFTIGSSEVRWYAVFILTGIIVALWAAINEGKKIGIFSDFIFYNVVICVPLSIIGARIWYIIFNMSDFTSTGSFDWGRAIGLNGGLSGLAIQGGVIVAIIYVLFATRHAKISSYKLFDVLAPGLLIGQIFGRWGNFCNHELYGPLVKNVDLFYKWLPNFIADNMYIQNSSLLPGLSAGWYQPMFLYESLGNLLGLVIILIARRKLKQLRLGDLIGFYLIWYGIVRSITETFRNAGETLLFPGTNIKASILTSIVFIVGGLSFLVIKRFKGKQDFYLDVVKEVADNKFDTVIFSFDGVIVDRTEIISYSVLTTLSELAPNKLLTTKERDQFFIDNPENAFKNITSDNLLLDKFKQKYREVYESAVSKQKLLGGVKETIQLLYKRKYNLTILTKVDTKSVLSVLENLHIKKYFNIIYTSEDLKDNNLINGIDSAVKEFNSKKAIYISSIYEERKIAKKAGVSFAIISNDVKNLPEAEDKENNYYIDSLPEIKRILVE